MHFLPSCKGGCIWFWAALIPLSWCCTDPTALSESFRSSVFVGSDVLQLYPNLGRLGRQYPQTDQDVWEFRDGCFYQPLSTFINQWLIHFNIFQQNFARRRSWNSRLRWLARTVAPIPCGCRSRAPAPASRGTRDRPPTGAGRRPTRPRWRRRPGTVWCSSMAEKRISKWGAGGGSGVRVWVKADAEVIFERW